MERNEVPSWVLSLDKESLEFIKNFVLNSGSLKKMATMYDVSYPTMRSKLDNLIEKISYNDVVEDRDFVNLIKNLVLDERISLEVAKEIIEKYKEKGDLQ